MNSKTTRRVQEALLSRARYDSARLLAPDGESWPDYEDTQPCRYCEGRGCYIQEWDDGPERQTCEDCDGTGRE